MNDDIPKILFVSHDASATGAPNSLLDFLRCIRQQGTFHFRILLLRGGPLQEAFAELAPTLVVREETTKVAPRRKARVGRLLDRIFYPTPSDAHRPQWVPSASEQDRINRFLKDFQPELLYLNSVAAAPILGYFKRPHIPVITYVRELQEHVQKTIETGWFGELVERTSLFISVSDASIRYLVTNHGISSSRFALIPTFVDVAKLSRQSRAVSIAQLRHLVGKKDCDSIVVGCGTTDWRKGTDLFIDAAKSFFLRHPQSKAVFVWIGGMDEGQRERIDSTLRHAELKERVLFLGAQKDSALLIAGADLLALTSREDPFPRVMLEAGIAEIPTVCFRDSGGAEEFIAKGAGIAVAGFKTDRFAEAVFCLLDDAALRRQLGKNAHEAVLADHNAQISSQHIVSRIEELVFVGTPWAVS